MVDSGFTAQEACRVLVEVARHGKTDRGRLAAVEMLKRYSEDVLRLNRVLKADTTRTLSWADGEGNPRSLQLVEEHRNAIADSTARTEAHLRRHLESRNYPQLTRSGDTVDVEGQEPHANPERPTPKLQGGE